MNIVEYDNVDPIQVFNLTLLALDFPPDIASLQRAGWQVAYPNWASFMVSHSSPK